MKKLGIITLIISFIINLSACVYLFSSIFAYLLLQVYLALFVFAISMGLIFYRNNIKDTYLPVILLSGIFSVVNVFVGVYTANKVSRLANSVNNSSLSVSITPAASSVELIQLLVINIVVTVSFSLVVILIFNRLSKLKISNNLD